MIILLNLIAWIMFILTILACVVSMISNEDKDRRVSALMLLLGYICTVIAFINK